MEQQETLRTLFDALAGDDEARALYTSDPDGYLADHGFGDIPTELLPEAVVHYADKAPLEVAEQLSPFVMAHSPVEPDEPLPEPGDPLAALAEVGAALVPEDADLDDEPGAAGDAGDGAGPDVDTADLDDLADADTAFGAGHDGEAPEPAPVEDTDDLGTEAAAPIAVSAEDLGPDPLDLDEITTDELLFAEVQVEEAETVEDEWDDVI